MILTEKELPVINAALKRGKDIRIQRTRDGFRILEDTTRVLCRLGEDDKPRQGEGSKVLNQTHPIGI